MQHNEHALPIQETLKAGVDSGEHITHLPTPPSEGIPPIESATVLPYLQRLEELVRLLLSRSDGTSPGLMTVKEAARFLKISERTIRAQLASKQWPGYRCGAAVRVDPLEIKARMKRVPFGTKRSRTSQSPS